MGFSRRELLLTSWGDRIKMQPAEQVRFAFQRRELETALTNAGKPILTEICAEFQAEKAEEEALHGVPAAALPALPRRRRGGPLPGR